MRILSFEAVGLNGADRPVSIEFHPDLNILTGRNGSGKTTILKLIWYVISGNIELAMREITFSRVTIVTDEYEIVVHIVAPMTSKVELRTRNESYVFEDVQDEDDRYFDAEDQANRAVMELGGSVFFPTFRRIEGGFSLGRSARRTTSGTTIRATQRGPGDLEEGLVSLARRLTNLDHTFVASVSTSDIVALLMQKYTEMSSISNALQTQVSQSVIEKIKRYQYKEEADVSPDMILEEVRAEIEQMDKKREQTLAPLTAVQTLVQSLLQHTGIRLSAQLSFGDAATAINSDALSAGEKQMLSFVCYNAFVKSSVVVIDEPELSLHVDWQRMLFPTLKEQGTSNQFIVATHSPFIYAKYPDKEIMLSADRGAQINDGAY